MMPKKPAPHSMRGWIPVFGGREEHPPIARKMSPEPGQEHSVIVNVAGLMALYIGGVRMQSESLDETYACQACGACCAYSAEWPRFSLETEADLDRIPVAYVDDGGGRMRCEGDRCTALTGEIGVATSCAIYAVRPQVCRACLPGDDACRTARRKFNL